MALSIRIGVRTYIPTTPHQRSPPKPTNTQQHEEQLTTAPNKCLPGPTAAVYNILIS